MVTEVEKHNGMTYEEALASLRPFIRHFIRVTGWEKLKDDLEIAGEIGVLKSWRNYRPGGPANFQTYAIHLIKGEISHEIRDHACIIRLPAWLQEKGAKPVSVLRLNDEEEFRYQPGFILAGKIKDTTSESAFKEVDEEDWLRDSFSQFNPKYMQILNLTRMGYTSEEIARRTGLCYGSVQNYRHKIRKTLKRALRKERKSV